MATRRTPLKRGATTTFTKEALDVFRAFETAETDEEAVECVFALERALGLPPWQRFEHPDWTCPYPEGSWAANDWHKARTPEVFELYHALKAAAAR